MNIRNLFKKKTDAYFFMAGVVLFFAVGFVFVNTLMFLVESVDEAFEEKNSAIEEKRFNLEVFEKLEPANESSVPPVVPSPESSPQSTSTPEEVPAQ